MVLDYAKISVITLILCKAINT
ncbi:hypothetical protein CUJ84_pRLN1000302 (plasmid) [Rhizobium leguminosarum]|uniref:Uncharacterized protein n=1 Tax=Rhizobium leguminosarum TaxID=384 RepID=A0A2K9ZC14_RHILE|nr:hypothetical protein CUJ84_pRLN1000302 [Rhizobium leguminosarum]